MPTDLASLRRKLSDSQAIRKESFALLQELCRMASSDPSDEGLQELVLRALEQREEFNSCGVIVDSLVREVGLYPYLEPEELEFRDRLALEVHRPPNLEGLVFHGPQARVYWTLMQGDNVVLSAPASFGKSLIIDAIVATEKFRNILVVVPTIALIDETRRRLSQRFRGQYKVVTHRSQEPGERNIFIVTQERALEFDHIGDMDFFVVDEFYKLTPRADYEDERCFRLNEVFYRIAKTRKQFYMLGPSVLGLSGNLQSHLSYRVFLETYRTVVSELHDMRSPQDEWGALTDLCRELKDPTIIFCSSPNRAMRVAQEMLSAGITSQTNETGSAANWVAQNYHPEWHFVKALASGMGIHHGRIPRALAQYAVRAFNQENIRFLICTSTLIEGVNTKAKNIIVFDNLIDRTPIDFFTFSNIRGRSGRMGQHFIGHVYLFHEPPSEELPLVDVPAFSQSEDTPESLLMQIDEEDLTPRSKERLKPLTEQETVDYEVLKKNAVDPRRQIALATEIGSNPNYYGPLLRWTNIPTTSQLQAVCDLIWKYFDGAKLARGSVWSSKQLAFLIGRLRGGPSTAELIQAQNSFLQDADKAVQQVLDFLRLWAGFHFPRLLLVLDRIQKGVFRRVGMAAGDYELFATRVENRFLDSTIIALDEYGIPIEVSLKIARYLRPEGDLDAVLERLRRIEVERTPLTNFEKSLVRDTQEYL
jgi:hypothetical protein